MIGHQHGATAHWQGYAGIVESVKSLTKQAIHTVKEIQDRMPPVCSATTMGRTQKQGAKNKKKTCRQPADHPGAAIQISAAMRPVTPSRR